MILFNIVKYMKIAGYSEVSAAVYNTNLFKIVQTKPVFLQVWSLDQQHLYYLETSWNANPQVAPLLNQKFSE